MNDGWWDKNNQTNMQDEYSQIYDQVFDDIGQFVIDESQA
jgi:hypothetical protein